MGAKHKNKKKFSVGKARQLVARYGGANGFITETGKALGISPQTISAVLRGNHVSSPSHAKLTVAWWTMSGTAISSHHRKLTVVIAAAASLKDASATLGVEYSRLSELYWRTVKIGDEDAARIDAVYGSNCTGEPVNPCGPEPVEADVGLGIVEGGSDPKPTAMVEFACPHCGQPHEIENVEPYDPCVLRCGSDSISTGCGQFFVVTYALTVVATALKIGGVQ